MGNYVDYTKSIDTQDLDTIYITGGGYINYAFKGISRESAMGWEEPVWGGDLTRSTNFVLSNIEDVDFGLVARVEVSYKYMNAQDYLVLCEIAKQRTCVVNYYSRDLGQRVTQEMAFTGNELKKLHTYGTKYLGGLDISIKLVATNRDRENLIKQSHTVTFNNNGGSGIVAPKSIVYAGVIKMPEQTAFTKTGKILAGFSTDSDAEEPDYLPEQSVTLYDDMTLYAIWE